MLNLSQSTKIFLCNQPIDMRKSFDGLSGMIHTHFGQNPLNGHLFVFLSKQKDRIKVLFWDFDGFVLYYKRLEAGTFTCLDQIQSGHNNEILASDFALILSGISPTSGKRLKRFARASELTRV